jgi:hypothetical protein
MFIEPWSQNLFDFKEFFYLVPLNKDLSFAKCY